MPPEIDVGASELFIAVPADRDPEPVRRVIASLLLRFGSLCGSWGPDLRDRTIGATLQSMRLRATLAYVPGGLQDGHPELHLSIFP